MKKTHLLLAALVLVIALMMIIAPQECIKVSVIVLGIASVITGLYTLLFERNLIEDSVFQTTLLVRGIASIVLGALAIILPLFLAEFIWTVMLYVIASFMVLYGAIEIFALTKIKEINSENRQQKIEIAAFFVLAAFIFCMPAKIGLTLVRLVGVALMIGVGIFLFLEWKHRPLVLEAQILSDDEV